MQHKPKDWIKNFEDVWYKWKPLLEDIVHTDIHESIIEEFDVHEINKAGEVPTIEFTIKIYKPEDEP